MDPEIKAKWIAALRSGEYPQIRGGLRTDTGYCCLGVLCDVVRPASWSHGSEWKHLGYLSYLSRELRDEIEFAAANQDWLIHMNDTGKSFAEIADYIEQNL